MISVARQAAGELWAFFTHSLHSEPGEIEETDDGNPGFQESCESYEAFAFTVEHKGRTLHVTVEDVTIKPEEA